GATCLALMRLHATSSRAWIVLGIASLLVTVTIWPVFGAGDGARIPERRDVETTPAWGGEWLRLTLCYGAYGFGYIIPATFLPVMARQAIADPAVFGLSWPIFGAAAITSTMLVSRVRRRVTNRRIWITCHFVMALGVALPVIRPGITATILAAI